MCFQGKYSPSVAWPTGRDKACIQCAAGTYISKSARSSCDSCPAGKYSTIGSSSCNVCAAGRFGASSGQQSSSCSGLCPEGKYSANSGLTACSNCQAGKFGSTKGLKHPSCSGACPVGKFSNPGEAPSKLDLKNAPTKGNAGSYGLANPVDGVENAGNLPWSQCGMFCGYNKPPFSYCSTV